MKIAPERLRLLEKARLPKTRSCVDADQVNELACLAAVMPVPRG
ncbi:hypothetical protein [Mesorhizobium sp. M1A.F.Ca.ET.072.01.1.1]|nr:hypothetical protein [Mesorhizobium sp. M1A.F.Ca.ET.072.01.1.1]